MLNVINTSFQYIFCLLLFLDFKSYLGVFRPLLSSKEIHLFFLVLFHFLYLAFWSIWSLTGAVGCTGLVYFFFQVAHCESTISDKPILPAACAATTPGLVLGLGLSLDVPSLCRLRLVWCLVEMAQSLLIPLLFKGFFWLFLLFDFSHMNFITSLFKFRKKSSGIFLVRITLTL